MTERAMPAAASPPAPAPARPHGATGPAGAAPAVARVLALQRSAGNAAVAQLLRVPVATAPPASSPAAAPVPATARGRFEAQMRDRWGVASVVTGTEAQQVAELRRMTPDDQPAPSAIADWRAWDPGPDSDLYDDIVDAFESMAFVLGGIPEVRELRFLAGDYANVGGTASARPDHAATYSGGLLNVFERTATANWRLPEGRSTAGSPAALSAGSRSDSRRRIIVHELAHGVFERFGNPTLAGGSTQFFRDWDAAAGWVNGRLEQNGRPLTRATWNQDWPEQPVSAYSLDNSMEDFAESLMCFIEEPAVLQARSPARHAFIQSRAATWRSALRAPQGLRPMPRLRGPRGDFLAPSGDGRYA